MDDPVDDRLLDPKDVALAALTNIIRLMGAELVAGRHRDDLSHFERAVRDRLASTPTPACPSDIAEAGLHVAARCIEQALTQVRAQAKAASAGSLGTVTAPDEVVEAQARKSILH